MGFEPTTLCSLGERSTINLSVCVQTLNYVEYMMVAKDRMNKKNKQGASFTDDGFSMGMFPVISL